MMTVHEAKQREALALADLQLGTRIEREHLGAFEIVGEWRALVERGLLPHEGFVYRVALAAGYVQGKGVADEADFLAFCEYVEAADVASQYLSGPADFGSFMAAWAASPDVMYLTVRNNRTTHAGTWTRK